MLGKVISTSLSRSMIIQVHTHQAAKCGMHSPQGRFLASIDPPRLPSKVLTVSMCISPRAHSMAHWHALHMCYHRTVLHSACNRHIYSMNKMYIYPTHVNVCVWRTVVLMFWGQHCHKCLFLNSLILVSDIGPNLQNCQWTSIPLTPEVVEFSVGDKTWIGRPLYRRTDA